MYDYFHDTIVNNLHFSHQIDCDDIVTNDKQKCFKDIGIVIEEINPEATSKKIGVYYKVTTYFGYDIAFFRLLRSANNNNHSGGDSGLWKISGETRSIVRE